MGICGNNPVNLTVSGRETAGNLHKMVTLYTQFVSEKILTSNLKGLLVIPGSFTQTWKEVPRYSLVKSYIYMQHLFPYTQKNEKHFEVI
jgi:hypothetical protein